MKKHRDELAKIKADLEVFTHDFCEAFPGKANDYVGESCQDAMSMIQDTVRKMDEELDKE